MSKTLADRVLESSIEVNLKNISVKVPKLKAKRVSRKTAIRKTEVKGNINDFSIISILIKSAIEKTKSEKKEKTKTEEKINYRIIKNEINPESVGGYGTISKNYGMSPQSSYVDYAKLFSHIGKFQTRNAYQPANDTGSNSGDGGFALASNETMTQATKHIKYVRSSSREFGMAASMGDLQSMVPIGGMDAGDWIEFKNWFTFNRVEYALKRKIA